MSYVEELDAAAQQITWLTEERDHAQQVARDTFQELKAITQERDARLAEIADSHCREADYRNRAEVAEAKLGALHLSHVHVPWYQPQRGQDMLSREKASPEPEGRTGPVVVQDVND